MIVWGANFGLIWIGNEREFLLEFHKSWTFAFTTKPRCVS
jgi:hypothetical protein